MRSGQVTILGAAALLLSLGGSIANGGSADSGAVLPTVVWDADRQAVFVMPPPRIAAWMAGEVGDEGGLLERWAQAYDTQRQSPGFARAVLEIHNLVRAAGNLTEAEINLQLIPEILHARGDLHSQLLGGESRTLSNPGDCWNEFAGKLTCEVLGWWSCMKIACKKDPANTCTIYMPCEGGDFLKGLDDLDRKDILR